MVARLEEEEALGEADEMVPTGVVAAELLALVVAAEEAAKMETTAVGLITKVRGSEVSDEKSSA